MKNIGKLFLSIPIISLSLLGFSLSHADAEQKPIIFGNVADLTGATASVGVPSANGRQDYFNYLNEKGGILGHKVKCVMLDGGESITSEVRQFNRLVSKENAVAIIGWSTPGTKALMPYTKRVGITYLSQSCSKDVVQPEEFPFNFIFSPTYLDQVKIAMDYVKKQGGKNIVIVRDDIEAWKTTVRNVLESKYAEEIGLNIMKVIVEPIKASDVTVQMLQVQALKPDFILCPNTPDTLIPTLRDGIKVGIDPKTIVGATLWSTHPIIAKKLGKTIQGYCAISTIPLYGTDNGVMTEIKEYAEKHPDQVKRFEGQTFYVQGWMQAKAFAKATEAVIKKNGGKAPEDLKDFRLQFRDAYENLSGHIFGANLPVIKNKGHKGWPYAFMATPKGGKFVENTEWMEVK